MIGSEAALSIAFRAGAATLALGFLEQMWVFQQAYGPAGPFSARIACIFGRRDTSGLVFERALRFALAAGVITGIIGIAAGPFGLVGRIAGVLLLVSMAIVRERRVTASDGAEQMAVLTLVAACVAVVPGINHRATEIAVWFIGAQSILSYGTAGIAKLFSSTWRKGLAVGFIMGSESHGQPWIAAILGENPRLAKLLTRSTVAFECAFIFVLLMPAVPMLALLAAGCLFRFACAISMGLNSFLLAFPGTYLCVAYVAARVSPFQ